MTKRQIGRRQLLQAGVVGAASSVLGSKFAGAKSLSGQARKSRPNILFIFTDQQTLRAMSAAGNRWLKTPHMDSIAAGGVRFENSYCTSPVCSPSRASLITGRMPHEVGVPINDKPIAKDIPNMGEVFRAAGYETAWTGKWHLPHAYPDEKNPDTRGFESLVTHSKSKSWSGRVKDGPTADEAIKFLKRKHDKPFLLAVSLHNPHDICGWIRTNPGTHPDINSLPPLPDNHAVDPNEPEFIKWCRDRKYYGPEQKWTKKWTADHWRIYLNAYYRFTEEVDVQVGRILTTLREQGLEDDTLIVFTSDHGEGCAAHKWVVKLMLYEEPVTVPMIVSWKGVTPGGVVDKTHLVSGMDVLPTMCDYAGVQGPQMTGMSLKPLIEEPRQPGREFVVSEVVPFRDKLHMQGRMVRTQRYKYVVFSMGKNPEMLFDMKNDSGETRNLAYDPDMRRVVVQHRTMLEGWMTKTNDRLEKPV